MANPQGPLDRPRRRPRCRAPLFARNLIANRSTRQVRQSELAIRVLKNSRPPLDILPKPTAVPPLPSWPCPRPSPPLSTLASLSLSLSLPLRASPPPRLSPSSSSAPSSTRSVHPSPLSRRSSSETGSAVAGPSSPCSTSLRSRSSARWRRRG